MAPVTQPLWHFYSCLRCAPPSITSKRTPIGKSIRLLSTSATTRQGHTTETTPSALGQPSADFMKDWGPLDPNLVENKRDEHRLVRREGVQPVGSRRRRAALRRSATQTTPLVPFEQLPYQCFQEARKFLLEDRQEKLLQIQAQALRIDNLVAQDSAVSGRIGAKEARLRSMRNHLNELVVQADINDPIVKKRFEDGLGDMNKPIYRHLADHKWRKYKRLILEQRLGQMKIVPDLLPALDPIAEVDLAFGRKTVAPGEFVNSAVSEGLPRLTVQSFEPGEKLVSIIVIDADVPVPETDSFNYRCHLIASNIAISPTQTSIPLTRIHQDDNKTTNAATKRIALPWLPPWAHKGAPYHRLAVFVLEQTEGKVVDVTKVDKTPRDGFILRSFMDKYGLRAIGATLFRTRWDESTAGVMERMGLDDQVGVEFKRKRVEPLPYKRRTERMR